MSLTVAPPYAGSLGAIELVKGDLDFVFVSRELKPDDIKDFKAKFGAEVESSKHRWVRSRYQWLTGARHLAKSCYKWQQSFRGRLARLRQRQGTMSDSLGQPEAD